MEPRHKIKEDEAWIRNLISDTESSAALRAWNRMMDYYGMKDFLEQANHVKVIVYIYLRNKHLNETLYCVSWKNYIGERTLYHYRKKYVLCFKRYYQLEQEQEKEKGNSEPRKISIVI